MYYMDIPPWILRTIVLPHLTRLQKSNVEGKPRLTLHVISPIGSLVEPCEEAKPILKTEPIRRSRPLMTRQGYKEHEFFYAICSK